MRTERFHRKRKSLPTDGVTGVSVSTTSKAVRLAEVTNETRCLYFGFWFVCACILVCFVLLSKIVRAVFLLFMRRQL